MTRTAAALLAIALAAGLVTWRVRAGDAGRGAEGVVAEGPGAAAAARDGVVLEAGRAGGAAPEAADARAPVERSGVPRETRRLLARLVSADGVPIAERDVRYRLTGTRKGSPRHDDGQVVTDADGRLAIDVPARLSQSVDRRLDLVLVLPRRGESLDLALPDALEPGDHDLGDLALEPEPLLVAGTVVDSGGRPVPGALVELARARLQAHTDAAGRFELRCLGVESETVAVASRRSGATSGAPVEVPRGMTDLVLTLRGTGWIRGRILHGVDGGPDNLLVLARPEAGGAAVEASVERDGDFRVGRLEPGTYAVEVRTGPEAEPCFVLAGVLVREGETARPGQLDPLDLRGVLRAVTLRIRAVDRVAVGAAVAYRPSDAPDAPWQTVQVDGRGTIVAAAPALDLRVEAPGYRVAERFGVAGRATIELAPGYRVLLTLDPPEGRACRYEVALSGPGVGPRAGRPIPLERPNPAFSARRVQARATVAEPGEVRVALTLRPRLRTPVETLALFRAAHGEDGVDAAALASLLEGDGAVPGEPVVLERTITVRDEPGEQRFALALADADHPDWSREDGDG